MASKKDFKGKKPTNAIEANAVEAFLDKTPTVEEPEELPEQIQETEQPENSPAPAVKKSRKAEIRDQRLQVVLTPSLLHYVKAAAWYERTTVNNYLCSLLENVKKNDKNALATEMEYDRGNNK